VSGAPCESLVEGIEVEEEPARPGAAFHSLRAAPGLRKTQRSSPATIVGTIDALSLASDAMSGHGLLEKRLEIAVGATPERVKTAAGRSADDRCV
jgi:hypothetical protein